MLALAAALALASLIPRSAGPLDPPLDELLAAWRDEPGEGWHLHEIDISEAANQNSQLRIKWELNADGAQYTFGGWNIDDLTIFAVKEL